MAESILFVYLVGVSLSLFYTVCIATRVRQKSCIPREEMGGGRKETGRKRKEKSNEKQ